MLKKKLLLSFLSAIFALGLANRVAIAQTRPETDPRFEKLAKDLYPKAKQEGALVVYTVWDVDHIRSLLAAFSKRFPGINGTYWQATRSEVTTRTLTEYQGNQSTVDRYRSTFGSSRGRRDETLPNCPGQFVDRQ